MDFYHKKSFLPNPLAMKISSYHKQQNHLINFVTESYHIDMAYDIYYIIREKKTTPRPPSTLLDDKRVRLIGNQFRYENQFWRPTQIIAAARPDYMLYPEKENSSYYNAHIVQFYHNGKRLELKQPFKNTIKGHKKTLVIDRDFWDAKQEDIILSLEELLAYKNIAFLGPIKLKNIILDDTIKEYFYKLKFSQATTFLFQNNYGSNFEDIVEIVKFIEELKKKNNHVKIGPFPVKTVTTDHWNRDLTEASKNGIWDLERCLRIADYTKRKKIHVLFIAPERRKMETPFWYYFEPLEIWSRYLEKHSYIELMLYSAAERYNETWFEILTNTSRWGVPNVRFLLEVMINRPDLIKKYGLTQWGERSIDQVLITWDIIEEYKYIKKEEQDIESNLFRHRNNRI